MLLNPAGDEYESFDGAADTCRYAGEVWQMLGLYGGEPVLTSPTGEWLELDAAELTLSVYVGNKAVWSAPFESFSGDWAAATFSPDGRYIVVGCPCDVDLGLGGGHQPSREPNGIGGAGRFRPPRSHATSPFRHSRVRYSSSRPSACGEQVQPEQPLVVAHVCRGR